MEDLKQRLVDFRIMTNLKTVYNGTELKEIFALYNEITKENRQVTTCSSCVSSVITRIKQECRKYGI